MCSCNEVLAVLAESKRSLNAQAICGALSPTNPSGAHSPLRRRVLKALDRLRARNFVERAVVYPCGLHEVTVYSATKDGRAFHKSDQRIETGKRLRKVSAPRVVADTFRERLWKALRIKNRGTLPELIEAARRDGDAANVGNNARAYLKALQRARIVLAQGAKNQRQRARGFAPTSNGFIVWRLSLDLGPKAPVPHKEFLFDPNARERIPYDAPASKAAA